jgi:hypothetical protein
MIILTLKERQLIDEAVLRFGDDKERRIWQEWAQDHSEVRYGPASPLDDGRGRFPSHVKNVVTNALERYQRLLQSKIDAAPLDDDEAADLCNDVAEINSTTEAIRSAA